MIGSIFQIRRLVFDWRGCPWNLDRHFLRRKSVDASHIHRLHGTRIAARMACCEGAVWRNVEQRHSSSTSARVVRQTVGEELSEFLVVSSVDAVD